MWAAWHGVRGNNDLQTKSKRAIARKCIASQEQDQRRVNQEGEKQRLQQIDMRR